MSIWRLSALVLCAALVSLTSAAPCGLTAIPHIPLFNATTPEYVNITVMPGEGGPWFYYSFGASLPLTKLDYAGQFTQGFPVVRNNASDPSQPASVAAYPCVLDADAVSANPTCEELQTKCTATRDSEMLLRPGFQSTLEPNATVPAGPSYLVFEVTTSTLTMYSLSIAVTQDRGIVEPSPSPSASPTDTPLPSPSGNSSCAHNEAVTVPIAGSGASLSINLNATTVYMFDTIGSDDNPAVLQLSFPTPAGASGTNTSIDFWICTSDACPTSSWDAADCADFSVTAPDTFTLPAAYGFTNASGYFGFTNFKGPSTATAVSITQKTLHTRDCDVDQPEIVPYGSNIAIVSWEPQPGHWETISYKVDPTVYPIEDTCLDVSLIGLKMKDGKPTTIPSFTAYLCNTEVCPTGGTNACSHSDPSKGIKINSENRQYSGVLPIALDPDRKPSNSSTPITAYLGVWIDYEEFEDPMTASLFLNLRNCSAPHPSPSPIIPPTSCLDVPEVDVPVDGTGVLEFTTHGRVGEWDQVEFDVHFPAACLTYEISLVDTGHNNSTPSPVPSSNSSTPSPIPSPVPTNNGSANTSASPTPVIPPVSPTPTPNNNGSSNNNDSFVNGGRFLPKFTQVRTPVVAGGSVELSLCVQSTCPGDGCANPVNISLDSLNPSASGVTTSSAEAPTGYFGVYFSGGNSQVKVDVSQKDCPVPSPTANPTPSVTSTPTGNPTSTATASPGASPSGPAPSPTPGPNGYTEPPISGNQTNAFVVDSLPGKGYFWYVKGEDPDIAILFMAPLTSEDPNDPNHTPVPNKNGYYDKEQDAEIAVEMARKGILTGQWSFLFNPEQKLLTLQREVTVDGNNTLVRRARYSRGRRVPRKFHAKSYSLAQAATAPQQAAGKTTTEIMAFKLNVHGTFRLNEIENEIRAAAKANQISTPSPSPAASPSPKKKGLGTAAIVGIVAGVLAIGMIVVVLVFINKRSSSRLENPEGYSQMHDDGHHSVAPPPPPMHHPEPHHDDGHHHDGHHDDGHHHA